jgi:hypothetical protein
MLAINARRQGMEATILYTFMGINVIRKDRAGNCKFIPAGTMGAIPGMASVTTWMMKRQIDKAGVPTVEELLEMAQYLSVFRPDARLGTWIWLRTGQLVIASSFSAISSFVRNTQVLDSE